MAEFSQKKAMARHDGHAPERIVSGAPLDDDARLDASVRPKTLAEYIGQKRVKENIAIAIEAARSRGEALDHVRSEEHTSELQSHSDLVCRLLLEKKKKQRVGKIPVAFSI